MGSAVEGAGMERNPAYVTKDSDLDHSVVCEMAQNGPRWYRVIIDSLEDELPVRALFGISYDDLTGVADLEMLRPLACPLVGRSSN